MTEKNLAMEADSDRVNLPDALRDASTWRSVLLPAPSHQVVPTSAAGRQNFQARTIAVHARLSRRSAHGCACLCPAYSEGHDAMQQLRVVKPVMPGRCSELLAFCYFGVGIGFNEIWSAVGREAEVDTRISIEPQCPIYAFCCSLNAGVCLRREVLGWPVHNSDALLIFGIVLGLFGGYLPRALTAQAAEFQFPNRQNAQPIVAEHADIELTPFDVLFGDGGSSEPLVNESDALCELLVRIDDRCLRDPVGSILAQALDDQRQRKARRPPDLVALRKHGEGRHRDPAMVHQRL